MIEVMPSPAGCIDRRPSSRWHKFFMRVIEVDYRFHCGALGLVKAYFQKGFTLVGADP